MIRKSDIALIVIGAAALTAIFHYSPADRTSAQEYYSTPVSSSTSLINTDGLNISSPAERFYPSQVIQSPAQVTHIICDNCYSPSYSELYLTSKGY